MREHPIYRVIAIAVALCLPAAAQAPAPAPRLNLVVVQGEGVINNIKLRTSRQTIVRVEDENHRPVAGATVTFLLPDQGAGATFPNGAKTFSMTTKADGRATVRLHPNSVQGNFQIHVNAAFQGQTAAATIVQTNAIAAGVAGGAGAATAGTILGVSKAVFIAVVVGAAAVAGGAVAATHSGGGDSGNRPSTATVGLGGGPVTIGPPR